QASPTLARPTYTGQAAPPARPSTGPGQPTPARPACTGQPYTSQANPTPARPTPARPTPTGRPASPARPTYTGQASPYQQAQPYTRQASLHRPGQPTPARPAYTEPTLQASLHRGQPTGHPTPARPAPTPWASCLSPTLHGQASPTSQVAYTSQASLPAGQPYTSRPALHGQASPTGQASLQDTGQASYRPALHRPGQPYTSQAQPTGQASPYTPARPAYHRPGQQQANPTPATSLQPGQPYTSQASPWQAAYTGGQPHQPAVRQYLLSAPSQCLLVPPSPVPLPVLQQCAFTVPFTSAPSQYPLHDCLTSTPSSSQQCPSRCPPTGTFTVPLSAPSLCPSPVPPSRALSPVPFNGTPFLILSPVPSGALLSAQHQCLTSYLQQLPFTSTLMQYPLQVPFTVPLISTSFHQCPSPVPFTHYFTVPFLVPLHSALHPVPFNLPFTVPLPVPFSPVPLHWPLH
ncbi:extensin-like, partial [Homarus americanus]|uniref:extensin-like n=1 Tax=Homarus americanus TaxID=6706 RepID=UPI001C486A34